MLDQGNCQLAMAGCNAPQKRSMGNTQDAHTGPVASMLSAMCRRVWTVTGQVLTCLGAY